MANAREIKTRIKTVKNTAKITRTMEMVATAKSKKAFDRIHALKPYADKIRELIQDLSQVGESQNLLLRQPEKVSCIAVVVMTANRGLCGGFNANILREARKRIVEIESTGQKSRLIVIGKKGVSFFRFVGYQVDESFIDIDEKVSYLQTEEIAEKLIESFVREEVDRVEIYSNRLKGAGSIYVDNEVLLPLQVQREEKNKDSGQIPYLFSPSSQFILDDVLPLGVKTNFFRAVIESVAAELIARRVAMKNATDAASEMRDDLTRLYNRSRQAGITQEIAEIVGGVEALK